MDKSERLNIRLTPEEHAVLRRAADLTGQSVSEYVRRRVLAEAHDDLVDRGGFTLDDPAWAEFTERLKRSGRHNDRLARLLAQAPPWEERPIDEAASDGAFDGQRADNEAVLRSILAIERSSIAAIQALAQAAEGRLGGERSEEGLQSRPAS